MLDFEKYGCNDLQSFFDFCRGLDYGWVDRDGKRHCGPNNQPGYFLQTPMEVLENRIGICWDQTELQRAWFVAHGYNIGTYFLYYYLNDDCCPSHSVLIYQEGNRYCWFEPMFYNTEVYYSGIHKANSVEELLQRLKVKFMRNGQMSGTLPESYEDWRVNFYRYTKPDFGISDTEFYVHCRKGERIILPR